MKNYGPPHTANGPHRTSSLQMQRLMIDQKCTHPANPVQALKISILQTNQRTTYPRKTSGVGQTKANIPLPNGPDIVTLPTALHWLQPALFLLSPQPMKKQQRREGMELWPDTLSLFLPLPLRKGRRNPGATLSHLRRRISLRRLGP